MNKGHWFHALLEYLIYGKNQNCYKEHDAPSAMSLLNVKGSNAIRSNLNVSSLLWNTFEMLGKILSSRVSSNMSYQYRNTHNKGKMVLQWPKIGTSIPEKTGSISKLVPGNDTSRWQLLYFSTSHPWIPCRNSQCRALMFSLLLSWKIHWTNSHVTSSLRHHCNANPRWYFVGLVQDQDVTPVLVNWSYVFLALTHRFVAMV